MAVRTKRNFGYWLRLIAIFLATLYVTLIIVLPAYGAIREIHPAQAPVCCETPADRGLAYQEIEFQAADGIHLRGWYLPTQNGAAVIALHGYGGNRLGVLNQASILAKHGFGVLLYDMRASGESEGESLSWGWRDVPDVSAAAATLRTLPGVEADRIGVYGCSTGAEVALASTALDPSLAAVVPEDAEFTAARDLAPERSFLDIISWPINPLFIQFMEWRSGASAPISLTDAARRISPRPLFIIASGKTFDATQGKYYFDLAGEPKTLWNVPDAAHCSTFSARPDEYEQRLVEFFESALLGGK
jgi:uncharacterized protein